MAAGGLRYRIVDVFSDRPLRGNSLCVVLDECAEDLMGRIAREMNLSETTFPTQTAPDAYNVRIFTPSIELPFAGHPSLGTAWALGPGTWTQTTSGATVTIEADSAGARMVQPAPELVEVDPDAPRQAAGLNRVHGAWVGEAGGVRHLIVPTDEPLDQLHPEQSLVAAATDGAGCLTFAVVRRVDDRNLHVRVFVPGAGIAEDPGTGSAAGPIATLAHSVWSTEKEVTISQGTEVGRPSIIEVDVRGAEPVVGGNVAACAEGRFTF